MRKIYFFILFYNCFLFGQEKEFVLEGQPQSSVTILQKYIRIPSVSSHEKKAGEFIKKVCRENGLHISDFGHEDGQFNFGASLYPLKKNKPNIIFLNHIDVVPEGNDGKFPAYSGTIENGLIYGRGAFDNKGAAIMQLESIVKFKTYLDLNNITPDFNVTFLAVSCEETQCRGGIEYVLENYHEQLNAAMVIGEGPTEITSLLKDNFKYPMFGISIAHKRTLWLKLEIEIETPGHSSITPLEYSNQQLVIALNKLVKKNNRIIYNDININLLKELGNNKKGVEKFILKHPRIFKPLLASKIKSQPELFALYSNTITLTNIYNNSKVYNKVPSKATAYLDCRLLPQTDQSTFLKNMRKTLKNDQIKITVVDSFPKTDPSPIHHKYYKAFGEAIVQNFPEAKVIPILLPNINDLGVFRLKNVPSYACNPVFLDREIIESIHNKNERLPISSLEEGSKVYLDFLKIVYQKSYKDN